MGITIVNKNYSTRNYSAGNEFLLSNAAQIVTDTVDIVVDYDFESSMQQQILIVSATSMQILNGDWQTLGISVGDNLEFTGLIQNGGNTVEYVDKPFTVINIQGDLLTLDATLEDPPPNPPSQTASVVGQMMPAPSGNTSNSTLVIVNTSVTAPESIEVFHNLVQNSSNGSDLSLFDGEVNRFRAIGTDTVLVGNFITMDQLGDQSGGTYISVILERLPDVGALFSYQIVFIYANPYKFESDDFDEPTQYSGSASLKPYYRFKGFPVANDPNSYLELIYAVQQGNLGWYDESYNQGPNTFVVSSVSFETVGAVQLSAPDPTQVTVVEVVITGDATFLAKVEAEFYLIPPIDTVKNQPTNNGNNISLSNFYFDETGPTVIETNVLGNNNAFIPTNAHSIVLGVNEITVGFRLNPTAGFQTLINSLNTNQWQYRIAINVEGDEGTPNTNNAVSLIASEGLMIEAPKVGGDFDGLRSQIFYDHKNDIGGVGVLPYIGNPEDDVLYFATIDFEKADTWASANLDVRITRDSDSEFFILQEQPIPFAPYVTTPDGVQQIDFLQSIQQFLDAPNRNKIEMKLNGNDTPTTYEVDITYSLLVNWREWLEQSNAFLDFFDNTLPKNGLNKEWMRYLRLAGYTLSVEVTLIDDANTAFRFGGEIQLIDYDVTPDVTTTVLYYDEDDVATSFFIAGQTNKIEATHVKNSGNWNQVDAYGWISIRPFEGEENKRISTFWPWTIQDHPLKPLTGDTTAELTFPALDTAVVTCGVDTNIVASDVSSIIVKIDEIEV